LEAGRVLAETDLLACAWGPEYDGARHESASGALLFPRSPLKDRIEQGFAPLTALCSPLSKISLK